jgi:hypothetical protein
MIDDDSSSEHSICGIRVSIPQTKFIETSSRQRRDWTKANWTTFKEIIDDHKKLTETHGIEVYTKRNFDTGKKN